VDNNQTTFCGLTLPRRRVTWMDGWIDGWIVEESGLV